MGRLEATRLDAVALAPSSETKGMGEGGMTGGLHPSVRAVRSGGVDWIAFGVRWARP